MKDFYNSIYNNCWFVTKWLRHEKSRSKPMKWLSCENRHELECLNPSIFYAVRVNQWLHFDAYPLSKRLSDRCQISRLLKLWCSLHCTTMAHESWLMSVSIFNKILMLSFKSEGIPIFGITEAWTKFD